MKKLLVVSLIGLLLIVALSAFAPAVPPVKEAEPTVVEQNAPAILQQLLVIFSASGFSVLLANVAKNWKSFKWMDGKTDLVVAILAVLLLAAAVIAKWFNVDLLGILMPWLEANMTGFVQVLTFVLGAVMSILANKPANKLLRGNALIGTSFSGVKK